MSPLQFLTATHWGGELGRCIIYTGWVNNVVPPVPEKNRRGKDGSVERALLPAGHTDSVGPGGAPERPPHKTTVMVRKEERRGRLLVRRLLQQDSSHERGGCGEQPFRTVELDGLPIHEVPGIEQSDQ